MHENRQTKWVSKALGSVVISPPHGNDPRDQYGCHAPAGPLEFRRSQAYLCSVPSGTMDINALVISGSDPGAVPGGSTKYRSFGDHGAETGSTNV